MSSETRAQPTNVLTEDNEQPGDEHVTTSDGPRAADESEPSTQDTAADTTDSPNGQDSETGTAKKQPRAAKRRHDSKRWTRLTAKLGDAERRAAEATRKATELQDRVTALESDRRKATPEPQLDDFKTPQEFGKAYAKWEQSQNAPAPTVAPTQETTDAPAVDERIEDFRSRGEEALGEEFLEALADDEVQVNRFMGEFILDSDAGPAVYLHLVNHPEESEKIAKLAPAKAAKALLAIENKLDSPEDQENDPPGKKAATSREAAPTSKAPKPPSSTRDGSNARTALNEEEEDMDALAARLQREELRKRGFIK